MLAALLLTAHSIIRDRNNPIVTWVSTTFPLIDDVAAATGKMYTSLFMGSVKHIYLSTIPAYHEATSEMDCGMALLT